ncbi:MAG: response regulator [Chloroflexota bacterium]
MALSPSAGIAILQENIPQMIFLDINMPGVSGFEVLAYLRREPRLMQVPVVIVTSDDQPETARRALSQGAVTVILKPVLVDVLESVLIGNKILSHE